MSLPVIQGKWSWPAAWSWGSGDHSARMRRERNTAGTKNCAESRAGSLRAMLGAAAAHCGVGGGHATPGTSGQPRGYRPFTGIRTGRGTSLLEAGRPCYCPYSLVAPGAQCRKCLRGISSRIFPGVPSEGEGIQTSGPGLALAARLPHTPPPPLTVCSTPDKYLLCCGTQPRAGSHSGM